jgi:hypothetical protein
MAEPYDFMLSKYIEIGKAGERYPNHAPEHSSSLAMEAAIENFGSTYTEEEYNSSREECELYVQATYANRFTRIDE